LLPTSTLQVVNENKINLGYLAILAAYKFEKRGLIVPAYTWSQIMNLVLIIGGCAGIAATN